jgi:hypothetical protein
MQHQVYIKISIKQILKMQDSQNRNGNVKWVSAMLSFHKK